MSQDKRWLTNQWDPQTQTFQDPDSGLRHFTKTNPANPDAADEWVGRFLKAIDKSLEELDPRRMDVVGATITLTMVREEFKAYLASLTPPAYLAEMWEGDKEMGE